MKKLWVFEWNDKWNSYADGSSTPFNSFLSSNQLFLMGWLMKRKRVDGGWSPKANSGNGMSAELFAAERRQRHSIHHQSNPIQPINSRNQNYFDLLIDVEWNGWLVRLIWRRAALFSPFHSFHLWWIDEIERKEELFDGMEWSCVVCELVGLWAVAPPMAPPRRANNNNNSMNSIKRAAQLIQKRVNELNEESNLLNWFNGIKERKQMRHEWNEMNGAPSSEELRGKWMNQLQSIAGPHCAAIDGIDEWFVFFFFSLLVEWGLPLQLIH